MNMRFEHPYRIELPQSQKEVRVSPTPLPQAHGTSGKGRFKYLFLPLAAVAVGYFLTTLSATVLWIIAASGVGLVALATAVCIYAINNTP